MSDQAETPTDTGYAPERWAFDEEVTRVFDDMLRRSIPQYERMREAVFHVASAFQQPKTDFVDLGCSRGEALAPLVSRFGAQNRYVGLEVSGPMLTASRERFRGLIDCAVVDVREHDLRGKYPHVRACVTMSVLTLQFTPIEHRQRIVRDVFKTTIPGGAFVLVEKVLGSTAEADALLVREYHGKKAASGYTPDEIERKRLALEGVLVPVTARWNEDLLTSAGFRVVECFWRWMNFAAWVAVRDE